MKQYSILLLLFIFALSDPAVAERKPNIIFLFADDQRADTIGAHGNPHIRTPNLDRIVAEGFSFRRNYCAGSFSGAVCVASRAMLMTGKHWMNLPKKSPQSNWGDSISLPKLLSDHGGYESFIIGKWHNGKGTLDQSFRNGRSLYMGGMANHADFSVQDLEEGELSEKRPAGGFSSTVFADAAIEFLKSDRTGDPFFLYVSFLAPHDPRNPPEEYREIYYENRPPLPPNFRSQHPFQNAPQATSGRDEGLGPWPRPEAMISDQICEYYGLVTHLDGQVGRIVKALEASPYAENTILVYTADHGLGMGSHGLLGKQNVYEQSMMCPLILQGPGIAEGKSSDAFTYIHDLHATLCEFAGVPKPEEIDSQSLVPVMTGEISEIRSSLYLPFQDNQRAVLTRDWKLHVYPKINHQLLFNLQEDLHELNNLATNQEHSHRLAEMASLMNEWREKLGDLYPLKVENPEPQTPVYDNKNRKIDPWQPEWIREKYFQESGGPRADRKGK